MNFNIKDDEEEVTWQPQKKPWISSIEDKNKPILNT
jgi:hypothetical protein